MRSRSKSITKCAHFVESLEPRQLLSGGTLDTTFNSPHGVDSVIVGKTGAAAIATAVQSDGKIVEVGGTNDGKYTLIRLNSNGILDTTFGGLHTGEVTGNVGSDPDILTAVAIQSDGKIIAAGDDSSDGNGKFIVMRFLSNGTLDKSFGSSGVVTFDHVLSTTGEAEVSTGIVIQKDGKIIVAGDEAQGFINVNLNIIMARLNTNGTLDTSFGTRGETNLDLGESEETQGVAIDYNGSASSNSDYGRIVVVGDQFSSSYDRILIARYNSNGKLDTSFAGDGHEVTTAGSSDKFVVANGVVIESGGRIVIAGSQGTGFGTTDHDFFLARFNSNGSQDTTFGTNGKTTTNFGGDDYATSLLVGSLGQQLIAGGFSSDKFALAAYSLDGKPFGEFGTNGTVTTKGDNKVSDVTIALAPNNKIVAVGGANFNTARYTDITLGVSVTSTDDAAGEAKVLKRVGKIIEHVPNTANLIISRDQALPTSTRVYFTISGTANLPNETNLKRKINDYTLSGMTISSPPTNSTTGYVDIPAGQTSVTVTMTAVDDSIPEPTELAKFALQSNSSYGITGATSQTLSILDNDSTNIVDSADAYVRDGTSANTNFGTATQLVVKKSGTAGDNRQAYFTFNLSSISTVNKVTLSLFGELNNTSNTNLESDLYSVSNTSWTETGITYNNKPAAGSKLASAVILNTTAQAYTFDITAYVKAQFAAGHKIISLVLMNPTNSGSAFLINSREASSNQPTLTIS